MEKLKVGLVGSSQLSFPGDKKGAFDASAKALEAQSKKLGFDLYVYPDTVITEADAEKAVAAVEQAGCDFLLAQATSFSAGFLAPVFAKAKCSLGLWAIPEGAVDGVVPFNSFCTLNMYSSIIGHYLKDYDIPFKWFFGDVGDELFIERFRLTVKVLTAIKNMRRSKIALIGGIAPGFNDLYFDERVYLKRFEGMKINRLMEFNDVYDLAMSYTDKEAEKEAEAYAGLSTGVHDASKKHACLNAKLIKAYHQVCEKEGFDALAVSCWPKYQDKLDYSVCSVVGRLNDDGIPTACEGDLPSAISMLLLQYLSDQPTMLMDMSAFDEKDETVLMWHCGPAASNFCRNDGYTLGVNYHGKAHTPGQAPNCCGVTRDMVFKAQEVTMGRLAGEGDKLFIGGGTFIDYDKPSFFGSRGWLGKLEFAGEAISARDFTNTILVKKFQHHFPIAAGNLQNELFELAGWLNLDVVEKANYKPYLQR